MVQPQKPVVTCMRRLTALALLMLALAVWWPTALAGHAELLRTEPAAGAVLPSAPAQVHLWFSEPVDPPLDAVVVIGPDGVRVDRRDSRVVPGDEGAIDVTLGAQAQGTYVVRWRAISADSHPINGEFQFSVGQPSTIASVESPISAPPTADGVPLQASARWLHLVGLTLLIGPERRGHHDLFPFFRRAPLHDEARGEGGVAQPADDFPEAPRDAEKFPVVPEQLSDGVHNARSLRVRGETGRRNCAQKKVVGLLRCGH